MNRVLVTLGCILALAPFALRANPIIFETPEASVDLFGPSLTENQWLGMPFSLDQAYTVTAVAALGMLNVTDGLANTLHAVIYGFDTGVPFPELFSAQFTTPACCEVFNAGPTNLSWGLLAGDYVLAFEVRENDEFGGNLFSDSTDAPTMLVACCQFGADDWRALNETFGIRIEGIRSVPEPTTLSLLGAGLIGFGFMRRKRAA